MIDLHSITLAHIPVWVPKKWAQKIEQYSTQKFLFLLNRWTHFFVLSLLKVGHLTRLLLSQVWYGPRKPRRFHTKKKKNPQPKPPCAIVTSYRTCDRWPFKKTWTLFMRVSKLLISIRNSCWGRGGMDCYRIFVVVVIFLVKEKINKLKTKFQEVFS